MASVLAVRSEAFVALRSALELWGYGPIYRTPTSQPSAVEDPIDLLTDRHLRTRLDGVIAHETLELRAADVFLIDSIPVTSIDRTLIDVGRFANQYKVGEWLDLAVRDGHTTYERFSQRVDVLGVQGRNGIGPARLALENRGFGDGWGFERRMMTLIRKAGLPIPVKEMPLDLPQRSFHIDFGYPEFGFGIECDSSEWHTLPYQIERDLDRQNQILSSGFHLLRYSSAMLRREPERVAAEILETLLGRGFCPRSESDLGQ